MSARLKNPQRVGISAYYIESKEAGAAAVGLSGLSTAPHAFYGAGFTIYFIYWTVLADLEIVNLMSFFEGSNQPARLLSTPGPRFGPGGRVAVLWKNPRILAARRAAGSGFGASRRLCLVRVKLRQALFQFIFLGDYSIRKYLRDLLMEEPKVFKSHSV
jgi:hypothetical protein